MAWLVILAIIIFQTGCGNTSTNPEEDSNVSTREEAQQQEEEHLVVVEPAEKNKEEGENFQVAALYYTYQDTYIGTVRGFLNLELEEAGIEYRDYDANNNQVTQKEQIKMALEGGADLLVVNLVNASSISDSMEIIQMARQKDVNVIFFNRMVAPEGEEQEVLESYDRCAYVGTDASMAGHIQGLQIGEYLLANYDSIDLNKDGVIQYAMFKGQERNIEATYRTQYSVEDANLTLQQEGKPSLEYFDAANKLKYQVDKDGTWSAEAGREYMFQNLLEYNETKGNMIELLICNNDSMAVGAIEALNQAGYNLGEGESITIPVFGVDATAEAVELIEQGKMTGTVKQDGNKMAEVIIHLTKNVMQGKELMADMKEYEVSGQIPNKILIPYSLYTGK